MSSSLRLQRQPKYFLRYISNSHRLFLFYSLGTEKADTFLLQNLTRFHTQTAQKTNHLGRLIPT